MHLVFLQKETQTGIYIKYADFLWDGLLQYFSISSLFAFGHSMCLNLNTAYSFLLICHAEFFRHKNRNSIKKDDLD